MPRCGRGSVVCVVAARLCRDKQGASVSGCSLMRLWDRGWGRGVARSEVIDDLIERLSLRRSLEAVGAPVFRSGADALFLLMGIADVVGLSGVPWQRLRAGCVHSGFG